MILEKSITSATHYAKCLMRLQALGAITWSEFGILLAWHAGRVAMTEGLTPDFHLKILGDLFARIADRAGPVLTKLGQIIASREDIVSPVIAARLTRLTATARPMPVRRLRRTLDAAYGPESPFLEFTEEPLGVGSVGQVHRAKLRDGTSVVVKVLKPWVKEDIEQDMHLLRALFDLLDILLPKSQAPAAKLLRRLTDDLELGLLEETNFRLELENIKRSAFRLAKNKSLAVPTVFPDLSSHNILVMEELKGRRLSDLARSDSLDPAVKEKLSREALQTILRQIFEDGFFHADPHGGNLLLLDDGRIGLIDWGLAGSFGESERKSLIALVRATVTKDADKFVSALLSFAAVPDAFDREAFREELFRFLAKHKTAAIAHANGETQTDLEQILTQALIIAQNHGLVVPRNTVLLLKTLVTIDGVARGLDPELSLAKTAGPIVLRALLPRWLRGL